MYKFKFSFKISTNLITVVYMMGLRRRRITEACVPAAQWYRYKQCTPRAAREQPGALVGAVA